MLKARQMCEAFDEQAETCVVAEAVEPMLSQIFSEPFSEPSVRHSLAAVLALALSAGPVGVFLMLRRMSLVGDAMSHAILPGVAIGFLAAGLNVFAMTLGGLVAGLVIALLAGAVSGRPSCKRMRRLRCFCSCRWPSAS